MRCGRFKLDLTLFRSRLTQGAGNWSMIRVTYSLKLLLEVYYAKA